MKGMRMNKLFSLVIVAIFAVGVLAQTPPAGQTAPPQPPKIAVPKAAPKLAPKSTSIKDTKISMQVPEGFIPSTVKEIQGFQQAETQSFIAVNELPSSYTEVSQGFTQKEIEDRGLKFIDKQEVTANGLKGILISFSQPAQNGLTFVNLVLLIGDPHSSLMVRATFPQQVQEVYSDTMKQSLMSVKWLH